MAISVSYYSGSYTYTPAKTTSQSVTNRSITPVGLLCGYYGSGSVGSIGGSSGNSLQSTNVKRQTFSSSASEISTDNYTCSINDSFVIAYYNSSNVPKITTGYLTVTIPWQYKRNTNSNTSCNCTFTINYSTPEGYNGSRFTVYTHGGLAVGTGSIINNSLNGSTFIRSVTLNTPSGILGYQYNYDNTAGTLTTLSNKLTYAFSYTNSTTGTKSVTTPASASVSCAGLTMSGLTPLVSSSYSGRVLISTDNNNFTYLSSTSVNNILSTSSRSVYTAILSVNGSTLGLSNGSSYTKATIDSKVTTYNTNQVSNAASNFDSLYNSISGNISSVTTSNLSSLESYLSTILEYSSSSDSRYTTRQQQLTRLKADYVDYNAEQLKRANLQKINTSNSEIRTSLNNIENTTISTLVDKYTDTYNTSIKNHELVISLIEDIQSSGVVK